MSVTKAKMQKLRGEIAFMKENYPELKPNFSAMAKEIGVSRQTIAKVWKDPTPPSKPRQKRKSKFDPYYQEIREKFEIQSTTIKAVFQYMKARYPEVFTSYDSFKSYVRANKLTEVREEFLKSHVRYETEPGEEVQIDWKESIQFTLSTGEVIEFNLFAAVFGYSRYTVFIYSRTETTEDFIRCMIELMIRTGGVPRSFKTDNMSAIVSTFSGQKRKLPVIRQFEKDIETPIRLCRVRQPQSKGKVESANRFVSWLEPYQGELSSEEELIGTIEKINRQINQEPSRTTGYPRVLLMKKEKEHLRPLNRIPLLDSYLKEADTQKVPATLLVNYEGHGYSVPKKFIAKRVKLIRIEDELQIYYNNDLICTHQISDRPLNYKNEHYLDGLRDSIEPKKDETAEDYESRIQKKAEESLKKMDLLAGKVK